MKTLLVTIVIIALIALIGHQSLTIKDLKNQIQDLTEERIKYDNSTNQCQNELIIARIIIFIGIIVTTFSIWASIQLKSSYENELNFWRVNHEYVVNEAISLGKQVETLEQQNNQLNVKYEEERSDRIAYQEMYERTKVEYEFQTIEMRGLKLQIETLEKLIEQNFDVKKLTGLLDRDEEGTEESNEDHDDFEVIEDDLEDRITEREIETLKQLIEQDLEERNLVRDETNVSNEEFEVLEDHADIKDHWDHEDIDDLDDRIKQLKMVIQKSSNI